MYYLDWAEYPDYSERLRLVRIFRIVRSGCALAGFSDYSERLRLMRIFRNWWIYRVLN